MTCIRCARAQAPEALGLCAVCAVQVRLEVAGGVRRLAQYLAAWAEFDRWLRENRG